MIMLSDDYIRVSNKFVSIFYNTKTKQYYSYTRNNTLTLINISDLLNLCYSTCSNFAQEFIDEIEQFIKQRERIEKIADFIASDKLLDNE